MLRDAEYHRGGLMSSNSETTFDTNSKTDRRGEKVIFNFAVINSVIGEIEFGDPEIVHIHQNGSIGREPPMTSRVVLRENEL